MRQRAVAGAVAAGLVIAGLAGVGAIVASRRASDAGLPTLSLTGGARSAGGGGDAKQSAESAMVAEPGLRPVMRPTFVVQGDLPALGGKAPAYRFPVGFEPTAAQVQQLAAAFGVTAPVGAVPADQGGGWRAGPSDGSGPSVQVGTDALGSWWFNTGPGVAYGGCVEASGTVTTGVAADVATTAPAPDALPVDPTVDPAVSRPAADPPPVECTMPPPPAGVPSADEARSLATALFTKLGYDLDQWRLDVQGDEYQRYVSAQRVIDGIVMPMGGLSVTYGGDAAVLWASGLLAEPERVGDYPTVDTAAALDRLRSDDPRWGYGFGGGPMPLATAKAAESGTAGSVVAAVDSPVTIEPPQVAEPYVVTITGVERTLVISWQEDGTVLLVPGYAFVSAEGGRWEVAAVDEQYVEPAPTTVPATTPEVTTPEVTTPEVTVPEVTTPEVTEPAQEPTTAPAAPPETVDPATTGPCPGPDGSAIPCATAEVLPQG